MSADATPITVEYRDGETQSQKTGNVHFVAVTWKIPFRNLLQYGATEYITPVIVDKPASKFQLKILWSGSNKNDQFEIQEFNIYFLIPYTAELDNSYGLSLYDNYDKCLASSSGHSIQYRTFKGNEWHPATGYSMSNINSKCDQSLIEIIFSMTFSVLYTSEQLEVILNEKSTPQKFLTEHQSLPKTTLELFEDLHQSLSKTTLQLFEDLTNPLADETYSDVILKSVDGEECRAHKAVLATRSEVLKAHIDQNTTEANTNVIETPFEYEVLREVLAYIYTSKATRIGDIPEKLLAAADYYRLSALKSLCEEAIQRRLTVDNAIDTQQAELHSDNSLKECNCCVLV